MRECDDVISEKNGGGRKFYLTASAQGDRELGPSRHLFVLTLPSLLFLLYW